MFACHGSAARGYDAPSRRAITMVGMGLQGYAIWAGLSRSLIWPIMWPQALILFPVILLIYYLGSCLQNSMLASELHQLASAVAL